MPIVAESACCSSLFPQLKQNRLKKVSAVSGLLGRWRLTGFFSKPFVKILLVFLAGCAFPLSFAPFDYWPIGLISLLILLVCLEQTDLRKGTMLFYLFGVGMYGVGNWWIYVSIHVYGGASPVLAIFLMVVLILSYSLHSAVLGYVYMKFFQGKPLAPLLGFPVLWVVQEWVRTWFLTGFPWFFAGYSQLETPLVGYAPVFGVLGMSLTFLLSASIIYCLLAQRFRFSYGAGMLLLIWGAGLMLKQVPFVESSNQKLTVSLLQGNVDQHTKWSRESVVPILNLYGDMTKDELGRDLIIWPEAAITLLRENAGFYLDGMSDLAKENGSTIILGLPERDDDNGHYFNTVTAIGEGTGTYYKRRLVPFGEYVPLESLVRGLIKVFDLPMSRNQPGPEIQEALMAGPYKISMSICYEIIYPALVSSSVEDPDLLVTISNDTWFGDSIGPKQHMQMARMRAVEQGRYLLRGTNNGISALVNHRGEVLNTAPISVKTVLRGEVDIMEGQTPYSLLGDWPILIVCLGTLVLVLRKRS